MLCVRHASPLVSKGARSLLISLSLVLSCGCNSGEVPESADIDRHATSEDEHATSITESDLETTSSPVELSPSADSSNAPATESVPDLEPVKTQVQTVPNSVEPPEPATGPSIPKTSGKSEETEVIEE